MNNLIINILFLLSVFSMAVLAEPNVATDENLSKNEKIILTVAIEEIGYYPFNYTENAVVKGFSVDFLEYIEANSQYDFEFIILPWPRALFLVSQGQVDLILTLFKTPKREQTYHFIEPSYGNEVNQLFTLADKNVEYNGQLKNLIPYSIGTVRDYSYGQLFDQASYLNKLPALTEEVLLKLLLGKRTDIVISNPLIFKRLMSESGVSDKVKAIEPYVEITPVHMALTRNREDAREIKQTIGKLTKQLKESPYYQELLDKYQLNF